MKAVVFTLGCKVNECESDSLIAGLSERGYEVSDKLVPADLYIVNTCAVTAEAEKKSRQTASRIKKLNANAKIIFTGCASEKSYSSFADKSNTYLVTGAFSKNKILEMLDKTGVHMSPPSLEFEELNVVKSLRTRTYVKVQDGCNNFCSYCIIPYLRGRSRSRNPESIINEIKVLSPKEAVINGINLSAYSFNGTGLTGLVERLKAVDCRIRLGSLEVNVITKEFLTALKGLKNFAPHFHLSLQSGSNAVLKKMNRHYTAEEYAEKVDLIREYFPNAGITTDIIVGFPTETENDFEDTIKLVDRVKFSDIHPFPFSPRSGTVAYKMKDLPAEVKKARQSILIKKKEECKLSFVNSMLNKTADFLFEEFKDGYYQGYSENYLRLYIKEYNGSHDIVKVKIIAPYKDGAIAEIQGE
ncbi:MAG: tRNA (N(6)-L-threonylcarbamoyladenosine(37)-C(2))-methylthiotransferase MtaB [Clostridiales bacterium]|nr:tRNA (N(6)-L-threonylcarbamoyladenosine(37)-C(2))-methylthiotransferase MtaB [Clostridiales bacterium]